MGVPKVIWDSYTTTAALILDQHLEISAHLGCLLGGSRVSKLVLSTVGCGVVSSQIFRVPESPLGSVLLLPATCTYASVSCEIRAKGIGSDRDGNL